MQLLKQIWNERRSNGWLWSELLIVFVVLWYVVDWTYVTARTYDQSSPEIAGSGGRFNIQ